MRRRREGKGRGGETSQGKTSQGKGRQSRLGGVALRRGWNKVYPVSEGRMRESERKPVSLFSQRRRWRGEGYIIIHECVSVCVFVHVCMYACVYFFM